MPHFQYQADFGNGQVMNGTVEAVSEQAAIQQLQNRGMPRVMITGRSAPATRPAPAAPVAQNRVASPAPRQAPAPGHASSTAQPGGNRVIQGDPFAQAVPQTHFQTGGPGVVLNTPPQAVTTLHDTKRGSNRILRFLFSQLSNYEGSGVAPTQYFVALAGMQSQGQYRESLQEAARCASEGKPFSDVMEMYPDLYPAGSVGMVRAGEQGGFLPEAYKEASRIADQAKKMNVWAVVTYLNVAGNVFLLWPVWLMSRSYVATWNEANAHPYQSGMQDLSIGLTHYLIWPFGPLILVTAFATWLLPKIWLRRANTYTRHRWALRLWSLKQRATAESLQVFSWALSRLSQAGLSPLKSFELAAKAVPNLVISTELVQARANAPEGAKISQLLGQVACTSEDMLGMAMTAEMTGRMDQMMEDASRMQADNFKIQSTASGLKLGCWAMLLIVASWGVGAIIFALSMREVLQQLINNI